MAESKMPLIISTPDECQLKGTTITMKIINGSTQKVGFEMQVGANKNICFIQTKEKYGILKPQEVKEFSVFVAQIPCVSPLLFRVIAIEENNVNNLVNLLKNTDKNKIIKQRCLLNVDWSTIRTESAELTALKNSKLFADAINLRSNVILHTNSKPIEEKNEEIFEELNLKEENAMLKKELMNYKQAMKTIVDTAVSAQLLENNSDNNNVEVIDKMVPTSSTTTTLTEHDELVGLDYWLEHESELVASMTVINPTSETIYFKADRRPFLSCDLSQNDGVLKPHERFKIIVNIRKVPAEIMFFFELIKVQVNDDFVEDLWENSNNIKTQEFKWYLLKPPAMSFGEFQRVPPKEEEKEFEDIMAERKLQLKENLMIQIVNENEDKNSNCEKKNVTFTKEISALIDQITATTARTTTTTKLRKQDLFEEEEMKDSSPDDLTHTFKTK